MTANEQTDAILVAMDMVGPTHSGPSKMRAVASMVERLDQRLQKRIAKGDLPLNRLREFRQGHWPQRTALIRIVHDILAEAEAAAQTKREASL